MTSDRFRKAFDALFPAAICGVIAAIAAFFLIGFIALGVWGALFHDNLDLVYRFAFATGLIAGIVAGLITMKLVASKLARKDRALEFASSRHSK